MIKCINGKLFGEKAWQFGGGGEAGLFGGEASPCLPPLDRTLYLSTDMMSVSCMVYSLTSEAAVPWSVETPGHYLSVGYQ